MGGLKKLPKNFIPKPESGWGPVDGNDRNDIDDVADERSVFCDYEWRLSFDKKVRGCL